MVENLCLPVGFIVGSFEGAFVGLDDGWALGFPVINVCTKECNFVSAWKGLKLVSKIKSENSTAFSRMLYF